MFKKRHPRVFIGSSSKGFDIADAILANICNFCDAEIWDDGVFKLSESTLDNLINSLDEFDFAILVLTPDDIMNSKGRLQASPRDNVIFELGLFMGRIGKRRTFYVCPGGVELKLPSDLAGITFGSYNVFESGNWKASLRPTCKMIEEAIHKLGISGRSSSSMYQRNEVDIYYNSIGISMKEAFDMAKKLSDFDIRAYPKRHDVDKKPDAIFIGCLVSAELARLVIDLIPKTCKVKYLFRTDYPDSEGGDENGYKIGVGYQSDYNFKNRSSKSEPVKVTTNQLDALLDGKLTNVQFQSILRKLTNSDS
ncbi:nucleotide-binding protein [Dyadobacter sp. LJ53]|uniref:TIR domain-containing protein n=1 Tax=Dyadobacter chenwenxiniae TaxID=2906456 RepID=UPI001F267500|nr:nucleotide-binding protein [Dyadobacter chenwenxiniae]MCF0049548.1 nucleotide-binding protein [Dyadobacter chenwenxiniae]